MIEEKASVISLQGDQAIIQMQRQSGCQSCELSEGCGTGSLGRLLGYRQQNLSIHNDHKLDVGDNVIIGLPEKHFIAVGFLMYLLPLICLFAFAIFANFIFDATQWINAVASLLGLTSGLIITARLSNQTFAGKLQPQFIRQEFPVETGIVELSHIDSVSPVKL